MASEPIRDPVKDHLLTPKNSALIVIDYQPVQVNSIASMDRQLLVNNIVATFAAREARVNHEGHAAAVVGHRNGHPVLGSSDAR